MDTEVRRSIVAYVEETPGVSTVQVARAVGINQSTSDYHLRRLRKQGVLEHERQGRETLWFHARCGLCPVLRRALPAFRRPGVSELATRLSQRPATASAISEETGMPYGAVRWNASLLEETGILARSLHGRMMLAEGAETCVAKAVAGERCDMWGRCPLSRLAPVVR